MFLTGKLPAVLTTIIAIVVIIVSTVALFWIAKQVKKEVGETVPWVDALLRPKYWEFYAYPALFAHSRFYLTGNNKREHMLRRKRQHDYILKFRPFYRFH